MHAPAPAPIYAPRAVPAHDLRPHQDPAAAPACGFVERGAAGAAGRCAAHAPRGAAVRAGRLRQDDAAGAGRWRASGRALRRGVGRGRCRRRPRPPARMHAGGTRTVRPAVAHRARGAGSPPGRSADEQRAVAAEIINTLDACEVPHGVIAFDDLHRVDDPAFFRFLDLLLERMPRALDDRDDVAHRSAGRARAAARGRRAGRVPAVAAPVRARRGAALAVDAGLPTRGSPTACSTAPRAGPAGLRIAIGAARCSASGAASPAAIERALRAGDRPLFEFLVTEVLGELSPQLADFLLAVSVLPELDAERCAAVTGDENAAARLDADRAAGPVRRRASTRRCARCGCTTSCATRC